ncbi:Ig-like domain-containing protein, partial [Cohnella suwonensis]
GHFPASLPGLNLGTAARVADFDHDGDLDIYARVNGASSDLYYENVNSPPRLTAFTPVSNATSVGVSDNITLTFSHSSALSRGSGTISIKVDDGDGNFANDVTFESFLANDARVSLTGNASSSTVTINPTGILSANTSYYLVIAPTAFVDADNRGFVTLVSNRFHSGIPEPAVTQAGNSLDNLSDRTLLSFTTASGGSTAPTLTATGAATTFIQGMSGGVDLFSGVTAAANDSGETFTDATFTVTNVSDATEYLSIAGTNVALTDGTSGTIAGVGSYSVSVSAGTATASLTGLSASDAQMGGLIDGVQFYSSDASVTAGNRVVTLTTVGDSGSSNNSATVSRAATVSVVASNAVLTVTSSGDVDTGGDNTDLAGDISDGGGLTLREAIYWANANAGADTIELATSVTLASGITAPTQSLLIDGNGYTINGGSQSGFQIETAGVHFVLQDVSLTNFSDSNNSVTGGIIGYSSNAKNSSLGIYNVHLFNNDVRTFGNGLIDLFTGSFTTFYLEVDNSSIYDNTMFGGLSAEGAINIWDNVGLDNHSISIANSAIYNNVGVNGGGVAALLLQSSTAGSANTRVSIANSTFTASDVGIKFAFYNNATGGTVDVRNSIIAGNTDNIATFQNSASGVYTLNSVNSIMSGAVDFVNSGSEDYRLASTASNAINGGDAYYVTGALDVRRMDRIRQSTVDIGAYESEWASGTVPTVDLDTGTNGNDATATFSTGGITFLPNIAITQSDSDARVYTATVAITSGDIKDIGDETLSLTQAQINAALGFGITVTGNNSTSLTLTGGATLADFKTVLGQIKYNDTAATPTIGDRRITVDVNDDLAATQRTATITTATPDTTAPTLSLTSASATTDTATTLNFTSDEAGTYYYVVYAAADAAPNAATIAAQGTALAKGTAAAGAAPNTASVSGLTASTGYKAYVIVKDAAGNASGVATISFTTTATPDTTAPTLSLTSASATTDTATTLNFTSDEAGTYYYVVYAAADAAPDAATIAAQGTAAAKGTAGASAAANTASVSGLTASTAYKAYAIVKDAAGNASSVATILFTTTATSDTTAPTLS